jgi:hypothetical protein
VRRALRRLFSILLTLFLTSLAALWALSSLESRFAAARPDLPNFFNPSPRNAQRLAGSQLEKLARGGDLELVKRELSRLGGAALPHVLASFDTLPPLERGRAALALGEIAARMNISSPSDFSTPESAVLFWTRFWQDREMDFKPQLVRRLVTRLAEKSSVLRSEDVIQLDTYALPELIRALAERQPGRRPTPRAAGSWRPRGAFFLLFHNTWQRFVW